MSHELIEAPRTTVTTTGPQVGVSASDSRTIAVETYVWGYPLVLADITRRVQTNVDAATRTGRAPINQFSHVRAFPPATFRDIQHASPGAANESNWLPAPEGPFTLLLRCYSPRYEIASGEWVPPPVRRVA